MSKHQLLGVISDTSPASATTALSASVVSGLDAFDHFSVEATIIGGTGGTLNVYLQREIATGVWRDWLAFPQVTAGTTKHYSVQGGVATTIHEVGTGNASTATPALTANNFLGGHPGQKVRAVYVAGASTSAGAAQTIRIYGWKN